jgi:xanthine/uracil permease
MNELKDCPNNDKSLNLSIEISPLGANIQNRNAIEETESNVPKEIPEEARGLCWGAFFLTWIWGIGNRTWIALLALLVFALPPVISGFFGLFMAIVLLKSGRKWAWKNKKWKSAEHFNHVQRIWSIAGLIVFAAIIFSIVFCVVVVGHRL